MSFIADILHMFEVFVSQQVVLYLLEWIIAIGIFLLTILIFTSFWRRDNG